MKIVGICACCSGIAHTYMAREALLNAADDLGVDINIETQGTIGVENELTAEQIAAADAVLLAVDVHIEGRERFEENVAKTAEVVRYSHMVDVSVEGELGTIGDTGTSIEGGMTEVIYTDPAKAKRFVEETGIDSLAVAIGTCHGLYPKGVTPKLRMDVLEEITHVVDVPLVLHGGSGNPDSEIAEAVRLGIAKVNISSDYKSAFFEKAREVLGREGSGWDPNNLFPECIEAAKEVLTQKMELLDSCGKAAVYRAQCTPQWRQALV